MEYISNITHKTDIKINQMISWIGIPKSRYYYWKDNDTVPDKSKAVIPKRHWILSWEREAIIEYALKHIGEGYRRLTYMMMGKFSLKLKIMFVVLIVLLFSQLAPR